MINISTDKTLALLLPNTNKALAEVIKSASPEQLKQLGQNSDIKGVLSSLFDETISSGKSDKVLLDILKNANTFKDMGSFSKDLGVLQNLSKSQAIPQKIQTAIMDFIKSIETIDSKVLKAQISNSGLFLESKLAQGVDAKAPVKVLLQELQTSLQKSTTQEAKQINVLVKTLLSEMSPSDSPKTVLPTAEKILTDTKIVLPSNIDKMIDNPKNLQAVAQNIEKITSALQSLHVKTDIIHSKSMQTIIQALDTKSISTSFIVQSKSIEPKMLLPQIQELYSLVLQSRNPASSSILGALEKIVSLLNTIDKSIPLSETKVPQAITKVIDSLHVSIKNDNGAVIKEIEQLSQKLIPFTKPEALSSKQVMGERIVHDMKANMLHLSEEIKQTPALQNSEISKVVDKLSLQIDYYQLYSHLNNSSSLYFPFVWDQLEEGSLSIKKTKEKKFFCEINLNLKEHGELRVMLSLYEDNQINIHAFSESKILKDALRENITILRSAFVEAELTLREVRFFDKETLKTDTYDTAVDGLDMGFEVKV